MQYKCNAFLSTKRFLTAVAAELFETCARQIQLHLALPGCDPLPASSEQLQDVVSYRASTRLWPGRSLPALFQDMENVEVY